jgi:putative MATE family efflux protein
LSRENQQQPRLDPRSSGAATAIEPDSPPVAGVVVEEVDALATSEGAIRSGKLAGKTMWQAIWILALPVLLQQTLQACVGLVDKMLAGNLPRSIVVPAMDAIGIGSYVGWLIGVAMAGLGIGGQALIARAIGAGDPQRGGAALGQALVLSVWWGALVGVVMWFGAGTLANICELTPEASAYCVQYVRMLAVAMPCTGVVMVGSMCLHGAGETTKPSLIAVGINIVNIVFAYAFSGVDITISGYTLLNPFPFDWHVVGIAAGAAMSAVFGAGATLWVLFRGVKDLRLEWRHMRLHREVAGRIISLGVPNFFEGLAMWGVNLFVLIFIGEIAKRGIENGGGEGLQGAHIIAVQWEALAFLPGFAMGTAAGALAGQFLGAGNPRMAQKSVLACLAVACAIMGFMGVLFMTAGATLTKVISSEPVHLQHVPRLLFICGTVEVLFAAALVFRQALRGTGDALWPFIITTLSSYLVRLPLAWYFGVHLGWGIEGVWIGLCTEVVVRAAMFSARFFHGGWKRIRL